MWIKETVDALENQAVNLLRDPITVSTSSWRLPSLENSLIQATLGNSNKPAMVSPRAKAKGRFRAGIEEGAVGVLGHDRLRTRAFAVGEAREYDGLSQEPGRRS